jgi:dienelactone hydrolase
MRLAIALVWLLVMGREVAAAETVTFPANDRDLTQGAPTTIPGLLRKPEGIGPFPAVVVLHGCGGLYQRSGRTIARDEAWSALLVSLGYVVLQVDSFTPRGVREICSLKERPLRAERERPRDAYGALQYLQAQPFVRSDQVAILGWSHGGIALLWTIGVDSAARPKLAHDFAAAVAFYPGCSTALRSRPGWRAAMPVLMLLAGKDDWTPAANCVALADKANAAGGMIETVVYPGAYHDFDAPNAKVRVRSDVATTRTGTATVGTDPAARQDALRRVPTFLAAKLR